MEDVREAIGIDKAEMSGKLIFVKEYHNADANFIFHAIVSHCMEKNDKICFVLFHHTFGHFHNVGMKLGYNLKSLQNTRIKVIEPLKLAKNKQMPKNMQFVEKLDNKEFVKELAQILQDKCITAKKEWPHQKVYIIIDDFSHLFDIGLSTEDVWLFTRYIRSFVAEEPLLTLCVGGHVYKCSNDHCKPNVGALALEHLADLSIYVQPLETGFSKSVSGKMIIYWRADSERLKFQWPEEMTYLYKLLDRQVKLFEPGSSHVM